MIRTKTFILELKDWLESTDALLLNSHLLGFLIKGMMWYLFLVSAQRACNAVILLLYMPLFSVANFKSQYYLSETIKFSYFIQSSYLFFGNLFLIFILSDHGPEVGLKLRSHLWIFFTFFIILSKILLSNSYHLHLHTTHKIMSAYHTLMH